jgi:hypothetical protein
VVAFSRTRTFPAEDRVRFLMLVGGTFFVSLVLIRPAASGEDGGQ